jgi:hypothetical protein
VNLSVFLISIARRAVERAHKGDFYDWQGAVVEAVVFSWFTVEAMLNELAFLAIYDRGHGSAAAYSDLEWQASRKGFFGRIQAILTYLYGSGLDDPSELASDVQRLGDLRNSIVHYRFEKPPIATLDSLAKRGYIVKPGLPWEKSPFAWPTSVRPGLATWAHTTACDTVTAIGRLIPDDAAHAHEVGNVRAGFERLDEVGP